MKKIDAIYDYVKSGIQEGSLIPLEATKVASVQARRGILGETVKTIIKSDTEEAFKETVNVVKKDKDTGELDWVVTNPDGEKYVVADVDFREKYDKAMDIPESDIYNPVGNPVLVVKINEDILFKAPWDEDMQIKSGGFLVLAKKDDIYGIQEAEFHNTYRVRNTPEEEVGYKAMKLLEISDISQKHHSLDVLISNAQMEGNTLRQNVVSSVHHKQRFEPTI